MPYSKGQSGNMAGRPRLTSEQKDERAQFVALLKEATLPALESIAWLAHILASLHDTSDENIFSNIIVITDRIIVDQQLQEAIKAIDHKTGQLKVMLPARFAKRISRSSLPFVQPFGDS